MYQFIWTKLDTAAIFEGGHVPELAVENAGRRFVELSSFDLLTKSRMTRPFSLRRLYVASNAVKCMLCLQTSSPASYVHTQCIAWRGSLSRPCSFSLDTHFGPCTAFFLAHAFGTLPVALGFLQT